MTVPTVSIIIPVYNRPKLVSEAIESVLIQTYSDWELIVVDDNSTDSTWEVLQAYVEKDSRIKAVKRHREPKGAPTCRNIGVEMDQGKYLIFWDSDDLMAPWCVEERVRFMEENEELDFALFQLLNYNYLTKRIGFQCDSSGGDYLEKFLAYQQAWGTLAVIWKSNIFNESHLKWNENALAWQDGEIHIRAILKNLKFNWGGQVPDGIVRSYITENSITKNLNRVQHATNRISLMNEIIPSLKTSYKHTAIKTIKLSLKRDASEVSLKEFYTILFLSDLKYIIKLTGRFDLLFFKISFDFFMYFPFVRGLYYRIFIKSVFEKNPFWQNKTFDKFENIIIMQKKLKEFRLNNHSPQNLIYLEFEDMKT